LPDLYGYNIPKRIKNIPNYNKNTFLPGNIPNGHIKNQHLPVQDPPKFTQIGIFGVENIPSGNPGATGSLN
jgi:hypothetical protein